MLGNNDSDDSTEHEYAVTVDGEPVTEWLGQEELGTLEDVKEARKERHPFSDVTIEEREVDDDGGFWFLEPPEDDTPTADEVSVPGRWTLGDHSIETGLAEEQLEEAAERVDGFNDSMAGVLREAASMVGTHVRGFECPVCGINHGHADHKHDIREAFNVDPEFADRMEYNPYCHCGANYLSMLMDFYPYITTTMFTDEDDFEGIEQVDTELLYDVYAEWTTSDRTVQGVCLSNDIPQEHVSGITSFFQRVRSIDSAASSAPIANETRNEIDSMRENIESRIEAAQ
jgi:hypothetical protein